MEKLENWKADTETNENSCDDKSLKRESSSLISLNIIKHGRSFADGIFIKNIFYKYFEELNTI